MLAPGTRIGPHEIVAPLGAGGMGEVYRAYDGRLGREIAVKVLSAAFAADPDRLHRFEQEARAAGALSHPNLLTVFETGLHDGGPYIVYELLRGATLRQLLDKGPPTLRKALDYGVQIAHGLAAAHQKGIVHRDLKPENLFVTEDGRVKILDFGLAKLRPALDAGVRSAEETASEITGAGAVVGTVGYMSPEQGAGTARGPPLGRLRARLRPVRARLGTAGVQGLERGRDPSRNPEGGAAGALDHHHAVRSGEDPAPVPGKERGRALPVRPRPRLRPGGRVG